MDLKERIQFERKINNYISRLNAARNDENEISAILDDAKSYSEYLEYLGVDSKLANNPAVIETSQATFKRLLEVKGSRLTRYGIFSGKAFMTGINGMLYTGKNSYYKLNGNDIEFVSKGSSLNEILKINQDGIVESAHSYGIGMEYNLYDRSDNGKFAYDISNGATYTLDGVVDDAGNPFGFVAVEKGKVPDVYYEKYIVKYPALRDWYRNRYPDFEDKFNAIDENIVHQERIDQEIIEDEKVRDYAQSLISEYSAENTELSAGVSTQEDKIHEMLDTINGYTKYAGSREIRRYEQINVDSKSKLVDSKKTHEQRSSIDGMSDEEVVRLFDRMYEDGKRSELDTINQAERIEEIKHMIESLSYRKEKDDEMQKQEAEKMKNPIYRIKKKIIGRIKEDEER